MAHNTIKALTSSLIIFATGTLQAQQAAIPIPLNYERSAPTAEAAQYAESSVPDLAAAHALKLTRDLPSNLSQEQLDALSVYGPWLSADGLSDNAQSLIRIIQNSRTHGLNPEAYQLASVLRIADSLLHLDRQPATSTAPLYANESVQPPSGGSASADASFTGSSLYSPNDNRALNSVTPAEDSELSDKIFTSRNRTPAINDNTSQQLRQQLNSLLDESFLKLSTHMGQGVVNGRELQRRLYRDAPRIQANKLLESIKVGQSSVDGVFENIAQTHPMYVRMTHRMRDLLTEQASGVARVTVAPKAPTDLQSKALDESTLQQRLFETGDLSAENFFAAETVDALKTALLSFQSRHGIAQTGIADERTRRALNRSVDQEITAMALNLERWRWLPRQLGDKHIFVNIPDYRVVVKENGENLLSMVAVVGKLKHQTPSFSQDMSYMEFNPTWTVPAKIANKELIPKERRRPGYLASRGFDFLKRVDNQLFRVPASSITHDDLQKSVFPYTLQQRGGPINALGKMKFMMPNPYAIYLHDTQAKKHFTLNDRAFSHGCIRLSEPEALARLLLSGDGYESSFIDKALATSKTKRVRLRKPVPTHLVYLTTWVDENNDTQYRHDLYRNNKPLINALKNSNTLISLLNSESARSS